MLVNSILRNSNSDQLRFVQINSDQVSSDQIISFIDVTEIKHTIEL